MRDGFVKIAAGTPKIKVADCMYNAEQIIALMKEPAGQGVKVLSLRSCASPPTPAPTCSSSPPCSTGRRPRWPTSWRRPATWTCSPP